MGGAIATVLLLASACGDDAAETTTTTTLAAPWTEVTAPPMPAPTLSAAYDGPRTIGTICVDVSLDGFGDSRVALDELDWTLDTVGIDQVSEGCDVRLVIDVSGSRTPGTYDSPAGGTKTCWNGFRVAGAIRLVSDTGGTAGTWSATASEPVPSTISWPAGCHEDANDPLGNRYWVGPLSRALAEAFGPPAAIAAFARYGETSPLDPEVAAAVLHRPEGAPALAAALHHPDLQQAALDEVIGWLNLLLDQDLPYPDELWGLIPHLIAYGASQGFGLFDGGVNLALSELFYRQRTVDRPYPAGFDWKDPADWWALWEQRPTPEA